MPVRLAKAKSGLDLQVQLQITTFFVDPLGIAIISFHFLHFQRATDFAQMQRLSVGIAGKSGSLLVRGVRVVLAIVASHSRFVLFSSGASLTLSKKGSVANLMSGWVKKQVGTIQYWIHATTPSFGVSVG